VAAQLPVLHARTSAFSYRCRACSRCCYGKRIQVNPYELARLARNLDTTTTEVIARFTVDGGTVLATRGDTGCVFLGPRGCTVHADRPLVCRLYPLGRIVQTDGSETFVENEPHPETEGVYGAGGTVGEYLVSQGVEPYIAAADRYYAIYLRLLGTRGRGDGDAMPDMKSADRAGDDTAFFIDADLATQGAEPRNPSDRVALDAKAVMTRHLALLERWIETNESSQ
jgi:uncharacterized protein